MAEKTLYRQKTAAQLLGITVQCFNNRKYTPAEIKDGVKFYDIALCKFVRKKRADAGKKRGARNG